MADGDARGAVEELEPARLVPRRRGTRRNLKPGWNVSPGTDTQIVDRCGVEAQPGNVHDGGGGTGSRMKPVEVVSPAADTQIVDRCPVETRNGNVHDGGGGTMALMEPGVSLSPVADTIAAIVHLQRQRTFCIRTQSRTDRSTEAFVARECLGYHTGLPPAERKALMAQAARIRLAGEKPLRQTTKGGRPYPEAQGNPAPGNGRDQIFVESQSVTVPSVDPVDQDDQVVGGDRPEFGAHVVHVPGGRRDRRKFAAQSTVVPLALPEPDDDHAAGDRCGLETHHQIVPGGRRDRVRCETRPLAVPPLAAPEPDDDHVDGDQHGFEAHAHAVPTSRRRDRENPDSLDDGVPSLASPEPDAQSADGDRSVSEALACTVPTDGRRDRVNPESLVAGVPPLALPIIQMSYLARTAADGLRKQTEREMERLVATLPVASWQAGIKGFGRLGLAIIIAEAGRDLACYGNVAKLWKRLGLAVIDGERQRRKTDVDLAALHGYAPHRRAEMWTLADSMFRHQWKSGGEDGEGSPAGPYGAVYARRRVRTAETHPEWSRAHANDDARRVMFKALVADLWGAWHGRARP